MLDNKCKDYSQWFPGKENNLADSLSRDFHLNETQLLTLYFNYIPSQMPTNSRISLLPKEIISFLCSTLQTLSESTQQPERHKRSSLAHGLAGHNSSKNLTWYLTLSLTCLQNDRKQSYSQLLHNESETDDLIKFLETP